MNTISEAQAISINTEARLLESALRIAATLMDAGQRQLLTLALEPVLKAETMTLTALPSSGSLPVERRREIAEAAAERTHAAIRAMLANP